MDGDRMAFLCLSLPWHGLRWEIHVGVPLGAPSSVSRCVPLQTAYSGVEVFLRACSRL